MAWFHGQQVELDDSTDVAMDLTELLALEPDALEGARVTGGLVVFELTDYSVAKNDTFLSESLRL